MERNFILATIAKQMAEVEQEMDSTRTAPARRDTLGIQFWTCKRVAAELGFSAVEIVNALDAAHDAIASGHMARLATTSPVVDLEAEYTASANARFAAR